MRGILTSADAAERSRMVARVLCEFAARPGDVCDVILDAARITTGAPVWSARGVSWRLFTGWSETFETMRGQRWPREE